MKRRDFIGFGIASGIVASMPLVLTSSTLNSKVRKGKKEFSADLVVAGGGLGGCAAALGALRNGLTVIMTEETDWIGGQLTSQGVPPDEHPWVETHGTTKLYRDFRKAIRAYYLRNYPLTEDARKREFLNPGDGAVSRLCHEPRVALAVLYELMNPYLSSGKLHILTECKPIAAEMSGDKLSALKILHLQNKDELILTAPYFVDATELGDLLPITKTEYRTGAESKAETKEFHAAEIADPKNQQAFTVCFALDYEKGANHIVDKPKEYDFWRKYIPSLKPAWSGQLLSLTYCTPSSLEPKTLGFDPEGVPTGDVLNLWNYRRIISRTNFLPETYIGDISIINWPQNDYLLGNLDEKDKFDYHVNRAKQLNMSLIYWLQTEVPRLDGGQGWPGLRLRGDIMGSEDGMAKYPYVRESRRIQALFTILEEHVGKENRKYVSGSDRAAEFYDSVGVGYYHIDLHPSSAGNNYIDFPSLPFQIPLGALIPQRTENLLAANKNIGTTHITNGCYRLHPIEWNIGEVAGMLVKFALEKNTTPKAIREDINLLKEFQSKIEHQGIELNWPL